jgi:hypothetical protein
MDKPQANVEEKGSEHDRTFEQLKNKTDNYDQQLLDLKLEPRKTLLDKLVVNAFGSAASKVYSTYPDL